MSTTIASPTQGGKFRYPERLVRVEDYLTREGVREALIRHYAVIADPDWWRPVVRFVYARRRHLRPHEVDFIGNIVRLLRRDAEPSLKQRTWLLALHFRLGGKV
jgi:hypothetical protein